MTFLLKIYDASVVPPILVKEYSNIKMINIDSEMEEYNLQMLEIKFNDGIGMSTSIDKQYKYEIWPITNE